VLTGCQFSPAASRQLVPFGMLTMMVQVAPLSLVSTSIRPPLLARPTADGASLYLSPSWCRTSSRWLHAMLPAAMAGRGSAIAVTNARAFHMIDLLRSGSPGEAASS
jgi:hypothetical protein